MWSKAEFLKFFSNFFKNIWKFEKELLPLHPL